MKAIKFARCIIKKIREDGEFRLARYGSFWHRFSLASWRWTIALCKFNDHWAIHFFCLWVDLWEPRVEPEGMMESWGGTSIV